MEDWQLKLIEELKAEYGTVPPPYAVVHAHPVSMAWRMGYGESLMMAWWAWVEDQDLSKSEKIDIFRKFKPPHAWLEWVLFALNPELNDEFFERGLETEEETYVFVKPHFHEIEALGFGSFDDWITDYQSDHWD